MKFKNIFWGLILILFGVLLIGRNLGYWNFDWYNFLRLWPVLFILWGLSVLPVRNEIKAFFLVIVLGFSTWYVVQSPDKTTVMSWGWWKFNNSKNYTKNTFQKKTYTLPDNDSLKSVNLKMDAAAGEFFIQDTTSDLLSMMQQGRGINYHYTFTQTNTKGTLHVYEKNDHGNFNIHNDNKRLLALKLSTHPLWNIDLDAGASSVKFDLRPFKVKKLNFDGGAGSFKIYLGNKYPKTYVNLDAGASSIVFKIPKSSGCDLKMSSFLSGKNFKGFHKVGDEHFQTANFDTASNKIYLNIDAAISSFTIIRE